MQFRLQTISKQRDRNQKRKYIRLRALAHYETNIMTRGGFRKHIPRKRYEAWSTRALRYLNYDIHIKYAFFYEPCTLPPQARIPNYLSSPADRPIRCVGIL